MAAATLRPDARLRQGSMVAYRSSKDVKKVDGVHIHYVPVPRPIITIDTGRGKQNILLGNIERMRPRDYIEGNSFVWGLVISMAGGMQHSFVFDTQIDRDFWEDQLGPDIRRRATHDVKQGPAHWAVKSVQIIEPSGQSDVALLLKMDLVAVDGIEEKPGRDLAIYEEPPQQVKETVVRFVRAEKLLPTEGTSLYRLVKSLRQRQVVLRETQKLIYDIQSQHLGERYQGLADGQEVPDSLAGEASEALGQIERSIAHRLGASGVGAQFVQKVLTRNIEKLKMINDMLKKLEASQRKTTPRPGMSPRF